MSCPEHYNELVQRKVKNEEENEEENKVLRTFIRDVLETLWHEENIDSAVARMYENRYKKIIGNV